VPGALVLVGASRAEDLHGTFHAHHEGHIDADRIRCAEYHVFRHRSDRERFVLGLAGAIAFHALAVAGTFLWAHINRDSAETSSVGPVMEMPYAVEFSYGEEAN
jgi:hypothetical protein